MKVLIAADKFKGSLTAEQVCKAVETGVNEVYPDAVCEHVPLADGGEGTLAILMQVLKLDQIEVVVKDPLFRPVTATYGRKEDKAYIEMAQASGFELLADHERSATKTSSFGTGELIRHALAHGAKEVYLFVGGSATNDGGLGLASALGFKFYEEDGKEVNPVGGNLLSIKSIEAETFDSRVTFELITDVKNTLLGPQGASFQYGPQKGASNEDVLVLDQGLSHMSNLIQDRFGRDVSMIPGSGAAGGLGLAVLGLLNGRIRNGIESILDFVDFESRLRDQDLVITGEGKMDQQTLQGKVVFGVSRAARNEGVQVVAVCGDSMLSADQQKQLALVDILKLKTEQLTLAYCVQNAASLIKQRVAEFLKTANTAN